MSRFEDGCYGSLAGIALIGKVLAGRCSMKYTRAAVGNGTIPEDMTPKTMTGPAGYVMDAMIAAVTNPLDGECQVTVQIKSDNVPVGFYATCIVLFAEDPDDGEVPYTYLSLENEPEWIRPASSIVGKLATFDLIAAVGDVDAVTAIIDPEAMATIGMVEEMLSRHNTDPDAHSELLGQFAKTGTPGAPGSTVLLDGTGKIPSAYLPGDIFGQSEAVTVSVTVPAGAWEADPDGPCAYRAEVGCSASTDVHIPFISVNRTSISTAEKCGLCSMAEAADGVLRFWADNIPEGEIGARVALFGPGGGSGQNVAATVSITIFSGSWKTDTDGPCAYRAEVECQESTDSHIPYVSVDRVSIAAAEQCGLCSMVEAADGILRFWANAVPGEDISARIALFGPGSAGASEYILQAATAEQLGGVKIGKGVSVKDDGTISVDGTGLLNDAAAPETEVKEMLDDVFGPDIGN